MKTELYLFYCLSYFLSPTKKKYVLYEQSELIVTAAGQTLDITEVLKKLLLRLL